MSEEWRKSLDQGLVHGTLNDKDKIYVECRYMYLVWGEYAPTSILPEPMQGASSRKILVLFDIFVPKPQRNQGIARSIVEFLERRAEKEKLRFAVGPIMQDEEQGTAHMADMCERRGWKPLMPFCYIK